MICNGLNCGLVCGIRNPGCDLCRAYHKALGDYDSVFGSTIQSVDSDIAVTSVKAVSDGKVNSITLRHGKYPVVIISEEVFNKIKDKASKKD